VALTGTGWSAGDSVCVVGVIDQVSRWVNRERSGLGGAIGTVAGIGAGV
jgi:hypothetical protein